MNGPIISIVSEPENENLSWLKFPPEPWLPRCCLRKLSSPPGVEASIIAVVAWLKTLASRPTSENWWLPIMKLGFFGWTAEANEGLELPSNRFCPLWLLQKKLIWWALHLTAAYSSIKFPVTICWCWGLDIWEEGAAATPFVPLEDAMDSRILLSCSWTVIALGCWNKFTNTGNMHVEHMQIAESPSKFPQTAPCFRTLDAVLQHLQNPHDF